MRRSSEVRSDGVRATCGGSGEGRDDAEDDPKPGVRQEEGLEGTQEEEGLVQDGQADGGYCAGQPGRQGGHLQELARLQRRFESKRLVN